MAKSGGVSNPAFELEEVRVERPDLERSLSEVETPLNYSWSAVNVFTKPTASCFRAGSKDSTKHILKDVSGICRAGELLAIMGASGAGKTTLLNVLTGRANELLNVTGSLHLNGERVRPEQLTSRSAYVQQEDLFIGTLTVKEQLIFQARLRMDKHIPNSARRQRVEEIMQQMSLSKCQDTLIGVPGRIKGISGGETKRLAFACEMLTNPPLLFCDEPTSGLDSFMAQTLVEAMRDMTRQGRTVLCTIHQPSSEVFALFDRVLLLAEGRTAFLGLTTDALRFFERSGHQCPRNFNPADFFIATLAVQPEREDESKRDLARLCDLYDRQDGQQVMRLVEDNSTRKEGSHDVYSQSTRKDYKASYTGQFSAVLKRSVLQVIREPLQLRIKVIQTIMISLLLGLIFLQQEYDQSGLINLQSTLFLLLTNMSFNNAFGVVNTFCGDMEVLRREHENQMYRTDVFFVAKSIADLPILVLQPLLFTSILYYMVGLNPGAGQFFTCVGIVVLVANTAVSYGYLISCASKNLEMALAISAPLLIPFMIFGGFLLNSDSVPVYYIWLQFISWFNYANEALTVNQWEGVTGIECDQPNGQGCFTTGEQIIEFFGYEVDRFGLDIGMLFVLFVGLRLIAYAFLYMKFYKKKTQ